MAKGLKTGGRQKGSVNRKTAETQAAVEASGITPLDYMLKVMRDESADFGARLDAAKSAAPYVHAKLASMQLTGPGGGPIQVEEFRLVPLTSAS